MTSVQEFKKRLSEARAFASPLRELGEKDRTRMLSHLLGLEAEDRYLRFGSPLSDSAIESYVLGIDFDKQQVFGAFDDDLQIVAMCHFAPLADVDAGPNVPMAAEFGLSVSTQARRQGLGTAMFKRASTHARNLGISVLFMHCLIQNQAMMKIARGAGMEITTVAGEADAQVHLAPADASSVISEAVQEQIAIFDYAVKEQLLSARRFTGEPTVA